MLQLPPGYTVFGTSNNGSTLTAIRDGSTAGKPLLMIIDRSQAQFNPRNGSFSNASYRIRVIRGMVDADGNPRQERLLVDASFRLPVGSESEHSEILSDLATFIGQPNFEAAALGDLMFPSEATE